MLGAKLILYSCVNYILISSNTAQTVPTWPLNYPNNYQNSLTVLGGPKNPFPQPFIQKPVPNYSEINVPFEELQTYVWDKLISSTIASTLARSNPNLHIYDQNKFDILGKPINDVKTVPNVVNNYIIIPSDFLGKNKTDFGNIYTDTSEINEIIRRSELDSNVNIKTKLKQCCKTPNKNENLSKKEKIESVYDKIKKFESSQNKKSTTTPVKNDSILENTKQNKERVLEETKKDHSECKKKKRQPSSGKKCKKNTGKKQKRRKEKSKKVSKSPKPSESKCCQCGKLKQESSTKEENLEFKSELKPHEIITNLDQRCRDNDDMMNINLEYLDHDCQCIRNSRNNGNTKKSHKQYSDPSDDFSKHYMSFINDVISKQQFGSFSFDPNQIFPYNFEKLYQLPLYSNVGYQNDQNDVSNRQKSSSKKDSNRKASNKKPKNENKIKEIDLTPTIAEIETITDPTFNSIESGENLKEEYDTFSSEAEVLDMLDDKTVVPVIIDVIESKTPRSTSYTSFANPETDYKHLTSNTAYEVPETLYDDDEYYPDFTTANGAYITSSEEEEWNNFHNRNFYSDDRDKKREINPNKGFFKNRIMKNNLQPTQPKLITKQNVPVTKQKTKQPKDKISFGSPPILETPDFKSRKLQNNEIPHYIKLIYHNEDKAPASITKKNNHKKNYVETVYAPSKVVNYSVPQDDDVYFFGTENSSERNLCLKEGDTTIVLSKSLE